jgi:peroxiredoxin
MLVAPPVPLKPRINTAVGDEQVRHHVEEHQIDNQYPSCVSIDHPNVDFVQG